MSRIFISYRRADSAAMCGRIYDRLVAKFGRRDVFKDVDSIPLGVDFAQHIRDVLKDCDVEFVIIGRHWLDATGPDGRRLDDPDDFVRLEVEGALAGGMLVVPLLVDGATMPSADQLPESLRALALRNGMPVRYDPDFEGDMRRVIAHLEQARKARRAPSRPSQQVPLSAPKALEPSPAPSTAPSIARRKSPAAVAERSSGVLAARSARVRASIAALVVVAFLVTLFAVALHTFGGSGGSTNPPLTCTAFVPQSSDPPIIAASPQGAWLAMRGQVAYLSNGKWCQADTSAIAHYANAQINGLAMAPGTANAWATIRYGSTNGGNARIGYLSAGKLSLSGDPLIGGVYLNVVMYKASVGFISGPMPQQFDSTHNSWTPIPLAQDAKSAQNIESITPVSATEFWAIGSFLTPDSNGFPVPYSQLLHYNNGAWTAVPLPSNNPLINGPAQVAFAGNTLWITGQSAVESGTPDALLRYDITSRTLTNADTEFKAQPQSGEPAAEYNAFAAVSAADGWIVGQTQIVGQDNVGPSGLIMRFQSGKWSAVKLSAGVSLADTILTDIAVAAPNDVWVGGFTTATQPGAKSQGVLLHFDGTTWTQVSLSPSSTATPSVSPASSTTP